MLLCKSDMTMCCQCVHVLASWVMSGLNEGICICMTVGLTLSYHIKIVMQGSVLTAGVLQQHKSSSCHDTVHHLRVHHERPSAQYYDRKYDKLLWQGHTGGGGHGLQ